MLPGDRKLDDIVTLLSFSYVNPQRDGRTDGNNKTISRSDEKSTSALYVCLEMQCVIACDRFSNAYAYNKYYCIILKLSFLGGLSRYHGVLYRLRDAVHTIGDKSDLQIVPMSA